MKRLSSIFALFLSAAVLCTAQSPFRQYLQSPKAYEFSCRFCYVTRGDIPVTGSGEVWISGDSFLVRGNGIVVLCDGNTRWTVDEPAKEIYVESADDIRDFLDNPALLLRELSDVRETSQYISGTYFYEDQVIDLKFSSIVLTPAEARKKSFNPEEELKDYKSGGFVYNDLR